ncbi:MAG: LEA type 2 family protein [Rikenellaceae bacterium]
MNKVKFFALILTLLTAVSCGGSLDEKVNIHNAQVVRLTGLNSAIIDIEVENSSRLNIDVDEIELIVKAANKPLIKAKLSEPLQIEKGSHQTISTKWSISSQSLLGGLSAVMNMQNPSSIENYTIDYDVKGRAGRFSRSLQGKDLPIKSLIK